MAPAGTMKWDHEADLKVLGLVLNAYDLKVGGDALKTMNIAMGLDPKSQSISHRLGAARKKAASLITNGPASSKPGTPTKPALPLTPRGPKLAGGGGGGGSSRRSTTSKRSGTATKGNKSIKDESDTDLDLDHEEELGTPTPIKRERLRKSVKRSYEESGSDDADESDDSEQSAYDGDRGRGRGGGGGGGGGGAKKRARAEAEKGEDGDGDGDARAYGTVITSYFEGDGELSETEADSLPQVEEV